jgi:hypothetical protein
MSDQRMAMGVWLVVEGRIMWDTDLSSLHHLTRW